MDNSLGSLSISNEFGDMSSTFMLAALLSASVITAACASATPRLADGSKANCPLQDRDSVYLDRGPVYRDCAVDVKAHMLGNPPRLDYQPTTRPANTCSSVELQFVIDAQGHPEAGSEQIIRTTDRNFANVVVGSVPTLRFDPAKIGDHVVRQIYLHKLVTGTVVMPAGKQPTRSDMPRC